MDRFASAVLENATASIPTTEDPLATARTYPKPTATQGSEELQPGPGTNDLPKMMTTNILASGAEAATGFLGCSAHSCAIQALQEFIFSGNSWPQWLLLVAVVCRCRCICPVCVLDCPALVTPILASHARYWVDLLRKAGSPAFGQIYVCIWFSQATIRLCRSSNAQEYTPKCTLDWWFVPQNVI